MPLFSLVFDCTSKYNYILHFTEKTTNTAKFNSTFLSFLVPFLQSFKSF